MRCCVASFLLFLFLAPWCYGVENTLRFERLSIEQGLSQVSINDIAQDHHGFLWLSTQDGLNRYDGHDFKVFRHNTRDKYSISNNFVQKLLVDRKGRLWAGTVGGGLNLYHAKSQSFSYFVHDSNDPFSISHNSISVIFEDAHGILWIGTRGGGLNRFDEKKQQFIHYRHNKDDRFSLSNDDILQIFQDRQGVLWIGTQDGLNRYDAHQGSFTRFNHDTFDHDTLSANSISAIAEDLQGRLWVGTSGNGINVFDAKREHMMRLSHVPKDESSLSNDQISEIFVDSIGEVWVGTQSGGLNLYDHNNGFIRHRHFKTDNQSLSDDTVSTVFEDAQGIIWVGTLTSGLNKHDRDWRLFGHHKHVPDEPNSLTNNVVFNFEQRQDGQVWIATFGGGINLYHPETHQFKHYRHDKNDQTSISSDYVRSFYTDSKGRLWVATNNGLNQFDWQNERFVRYQHRMNDVNSLSHNDVMAISEDRRGLLWVATRGGGVSLLNPETEQFTRLQHQAHNENSLANNRVWTVHRDRKGLMWIGTDGGGLDRYDPLSGLFKHHIHDADKHLTLKDNIIASVHQYDDKGLWLGTWNGAHYFDFRKETFIHYDVKSGLPNDVIYDVVQDAQKQLWFTSNGGLSFMEPEGGGFVTYTVEDGLQGNEFNLGAFLLHSSGELYFGGTNGFNRFDPRKLQSAQTQHKVVLTDFLTFNKSVKITPVSEQSKLSVLEHNQQGPFELPEAIEFARSLTLNHQQSMFSIQFSALDFTGESNIHYAYMLEGWDSDWVYTDAKRRYATYTRLSAGEYVFKVKQVMAKHGANQTDKVTRLKIRVLPPPWLTIWAYIFYFLIATVIIFSFIYMVRVKIQTQEKANKQLEASEKQLSLALWASGDQLWDWDADRAMLQRKNILSQFSMLHQESMRDWRQMTEGIHPDDVSNFLHRFELYRNGESDHFECSFRLRDKNHQWRWVLSRGKIVSSFDNGDIRRITGTLQDVHRAFLDRKALRELNVNLEQQVARRTDDLQSSLTQLKSAQQQLVEAEKMAALGNLVSGIAHEVNTPLGICITMVTMHIEKLGVLQQQITAGTVTRKQMDSYTSESQTSQQIVERNLHRVAELIRRFKKVSVEENDEAAVEVIFHQQLHKIIDSVHPRILQAKHGLTLTSSGDWTLLTYPKAWWQIISQLVENSLLHGFAEKICGEIVIDAQLTASFMRLEFSDNGCGMSKTTQEKLYEPFYTTTRHCGNTGLGMHIVHTLVVQQLGGTIECISEPDLGVKYIITIASENLLH